MKHKRRNRLMTVVIESVLLTVVVVLVLGCFPVQEPKQPLKMETKINYVMYDTSIEDKIYQLKVNKIVVSRGSVIRIPVVDYNDITKPSHATAEQIDNMLKYGLKGYGESFVKAEIDSGVNALVLMAIARYESANGTYKYMDRNNIFSFGASDDNPNNAVKFDSVDDCISSVARYLKREYLTQGGKHYNGVSLNSIGIKYCSNDEWADDIKYLIDWELDKMKGEL